MAPPTKTPGCKESCAYFVHCQSARWSLEEEQKELRDRCVKDCEGAAKAGPKSQEAVFFGGIQKCAVGKACVDFGKCMREVIAELRKAEGGEEPEEDPNATYKMTLGGSPTRGPADAPVTVVMLADYECPFCARGWNTIKELEKAHPGKIRVSFKHFPLPNHAQGKLGAQVAICVLKQKGEAAFWQLHEKLFASGDDLSEAALLGQAKAVGADPAEVKSCMKESGYSELLSADLKLGLGLGVDGTPAFFLNGKKVSGAQPLAQFEKAYAEALGRAEAALKSGVKPAEVYEHLIKDAATKPVFLKGKEPRSDAGQGAPPELDPTVVFRVPVTRAYPARGPGDALVTIVEFADLQCPACKMASERLGKLLADFPADVRVVYRNFPLPHNADAYLAAEAALAVRTQKGDAGFFAYMDKLHASQQDLSRPVLEKLAGELGVDPGPFKKALDERTHRAQVQADRVFAEKMAVPGTPAFFINGKVMMGLPPDYETLKARIQQEIDAAKKTLGKGIGRAGLYYHLMKDARSEPVFLGPPK
jgi:protein-disulfide isomerase